MLLLVRHGETAANAAGLLLGRADPPLTDLGCHQAATLARVLPPPTRLISSPLARARATAAALADVRNVEVEIDDRWIELDYGDWDQLPAAAVGAAAWDRWRCDPSFAPPGGESLRQLGARVRAACAPIRAAAAAHDGVVIVVTHVSPIKAALAWALGAPDEVAWRMFVEDASVSRIDITAHGPVVRWFNRHPTPTLAGP